VKFKQETDFQETEIGKIPREWKVVKLKDIGKIVSGFTFSLELQGKNSGKYPFIKVNDMNNSYKYIYTAENYVDDNDLVKLKARPYPPNTIIFPKIGMAVRLNKYRILRLEALFDNNIAGVIINDKLAYYEFIYYYLQGKIDLMSLASMTTVPSITKTKLENIPIPYPSIHEQRGIAGILSTVDRVIEVVDVAVARLEGLKKALMRELLTGRIRVREENGKLIFNKETDFQDTEIGKIPREWRVKKLGELVFEIYYGLTAKAVDQPTELRMLRTTDIKDNYRVDWDSLPYCEITDNRRINIQKYLLRKNDLVVSRAGTTGMSILVDKDLNDVIFGSYLIKIKLDESVAYPKFIHYFMQSSLYWNQLLPKQAGSTLKNISLPILKNILTPLPPINEQKLIPEILSTLDRAIELYREERIRLEHLKRGLMDLLLTGKIRVVED
jgi:type I restriction enzyme S subunit